MQERTWPINLGIGTGLQARLEQSDEEGLFEGSIPQPSAPEADIAAFEAEAGERLPAGYRDFLLHANGWFDFFFGLSIFGLDDLRDGIRARRAQVLLDSYEAEEVLEESEIDRSDVFPVAVGDGADLVVVVREGKPAAGTVVWFEGGESGRFEDFGEFFEFVLSLLERHLDRHEANHAASSEQVVEN